MKLSANEKLEEVAGTTGKPSGDYDTYMPLWTLSTWTLVLAWLLYLCSLFLPCARIQNPDGSPGQAMLWDGTHDVLPGYQLVQLVFFPLVWFFIIPFIYCLVNMAFYLTLFSLISSRPSGSSAQRRFSMLRCIVTTVAAVAAWGAPVFLLEQFLGYYLWAASISLAAAALLIRAASLKRRSPQ